MKRAKAIGMGDISAIAVIGFFLLWTAPVAAQTALGDSIGSRTGPHTKPIGMEVGPYDSFLLFPKFVLEHRITDNLFASEVNKSSDVALILKPSFNLKSDWDNHSLTFTARAEQSKYLDNEDENSLKYNFNLSGRLDMLEKSNLSASLIFDQNSQARGDPDDDVAGVFESELTEFTTSTAKLGALYKEDIILMKLDVKADLIDYDDAGMTNNDDRDRIEFKTTARAGYEWVPGSTAFVEATYDLREFNISIDDSGLKRSSRGYEVLLGGTLDISAVTFVEFGVGYIRQSFDDQPLGSAKLGPTEGVSFLGNLIWNPSDLLTITGKLRRSVNETTITGASSALTSSFGLKAEYGLLEELLLSAGVNFSRETFDGINRTDDLVKYEIAAKYYFGPNIIADAKYSYEERFADLAGESFVNNSLIFSLTSRF